MCTDTMQPSVHFAESDISGIIDVMVKRNADIGLVRSNGNKNKTVNFKLIHGFLPWEEECEECGKPRSEHNNGSTFCVFERSCRKWVPG